MWKIIILISSARKWEREAAADARLFFCLISDFYLILNSTFFPSLHGNLGVVLLCFFSLFYTLDFGLKIKKFFFVLLCSEGDSRRTGRSVKLLTVGRRMGMWRMENHSGFLRNSSDVMQTSTWAKFLINLFAAEKEVVLPRVDVSHFCSWFSFFFIWENFLVSFKFQVVFPPQQKRVISSPKNFYDFSAIQLKNFYYTFDSFLFSRQIASVRSRHNDWITTNSANETTVSFALRVEAAAFCVKSTNFFSITFNSMDGWLTVENENSVDE